jgi:hypothetical protein
VRLQEKVSGNMCSQEVFFHWEARWIFSYSSTLLITGPLRKDGFLYRLFCHFSFCLLLLCLGFWG